METDKLTSQQFAQLGIHGQTGDYSQGQPDFSSNPPVSADSNPAQNTAANQYSPGQAIPGQGGFVHNVPGQGVPFQGQYGQGLIGQNISGQGLLDQQGIPIQQHTFGLNQGIPPQGQPLGFNQGGSGLRQDLTRQGGSPQNSNSHARRPAQESAEEADNQIEGAGQAIPNPENSYYNQPQGLAHQNAPKQNWSHGPQEKTVIYSPGIALPGQALLLSQNIPLQGRSLEINQRLPLIGQPVQFNQGAPDRRQYPGQGPINQNVPHQNNNNQAQGSGQGKKDSERGVNTQGKAIIVNQVPLPGRTLVFTQTVPLTGKSLVVNQSVPIQGPSLGYIQGGLQPGQYIGSA